MGFYFVFVATGLTYLVALGWRYFGFLVPNAPEKNSPVFVAVLGLALAGAAFLLISGTWQQRETLRSNRGSRLKVLQLSRVFFYPLAVISPTSFVACEAFHGFEYVLLWNKMHDREGAKGQIKATAGIFSLAIILVAIYYVLSYMAVPLSPNSLLVNSRRVASFG